MNFTEQYKLFQQYQELEKKLLEPSISDNNIRAYNLQKKEIELKLQAIYKAFDLVRKAEIEGINCTFYQYERGGCLGQFCIYFSWEQFGERRYLEFSPESTYLVEEELEEAEQYLENIKKLKVEYKAAKDKILGKLTEDEKRLLFL
jgi:hypothetical protein